MKAVTRIILKNRIFIIISLVLGSLLLHSCGIIKGVRLVKSKAIRPVYYNTDNRRIILVPNTHFGQPEFYADLTDSIHHWKSNGYRIYYEMVESDRTDTSFEINERKWRKINGGSSASTPEEYEAELQGVFKKGVGQPTNEALGITDDDLNADIDFNEFFDKLEELYGAIELDSCDLLTPIDSAYSCSKAKRVRPTLNYVMLDFRNENVVKMIEENNDDNIVIIYGMAHIKGILKLLKESDL